MLLSAGEKCYYKSLTPADAGHPGKASLAQVITIFQASIWELQDCSPLTASLQTDCIQKSCTGKKDLNLSDIDVSAIHTCMEQLPKAACKTWNCEEMYSGLKCLGKMIIWDLYVLGVLTSVLQIVTGKHENLDKWPQNGHLYPVCWPVTTRIYKHYSLLWNEQKLRRGKLASISYLMCTIDLLLVQFNQNGISPECWLTCDPFPTAMFIVKARMLLSMSSTSDWLLQLKIKVSAESSHLWEWLFMGLLCYRMCSRAFF